MTASSHVHFTTHPAMTKESRLDSVQKAAAGHRYHLDNTIPHAREGCHWVFGSNEAGRHGMGAAKVARVNFGAEYGVGRGPTGKAYAIPTKDRHLAILPLEAVKQNIADFLAYASAHPKTPFFVTRVGCGLAKNDDDVIGPLFSQAPPNCILPVEWRGYVTQLGVVTQALDEQGDQVRERMSA